MSMPKTLCWDCPYKLPDRMTLGFRNLIGAKADEARGWQPIETAPKDQEVWGAGHGWQGHISFRDGAWMMLNPDLSRGPGGRPLYPTHWMPLPPPPAAIAAEGDGT